MEYAACNKNWYNSVNNNLQICAGTKQGGKDNCYGDYGEPLYHKNSLTQIGIVSYGARNCGIPNVSGVYTRISGYKDFIQYLICKRANIKPKYCSKKLIFFYIYH